MANCSFFQLRDQHLSTIYLMPFNGADRLHCQAHTISVSASQRAAQLMGIRLIALQLYPSWPRLDRAKQRSLASGHGLQAALLYYWAVHYIPVLALVHLKLNLTAFS